jgi:hypothetical protein
MEESELGGDGAIAESVRGQPIDRGQGIPYAM